MLSIVTELEISGPSGKAIIPPNVLLEKVSTTLLKIETFCLEKTTVNSGIVL